MKRLLGLAVVTLGICCAHVQQASALWIYSWNLKYKKNCVWTTSCASCDDYYWKCGEWQVARVAGGGGNAPRSEATPAELAALKKSGFGSCLKADRVDAKCAEGIRDKSGLSAAFGGVPADKGDAGIATSGRSQPIPTCPDGHKPPCEGSPVPDLKKARGE